jgi:hypothetical protein
VVRKAFIPEQLINKLCEAEVLLGQCRPSAIMGHEKG